MSIGGREPGITVEGVWKKFRRGERHDSLRDLIPSLLKGLARGGRDPAALDSREFWALRDVNLEVKPGHALGIIGHNGAGKSTLLKLITKIMRPTLGRCEVRGRIGALIELAAGFHPDLTGRENVFLQGAIMGMPAAVIRARFDQIVEFSGISEFIDTPVKRYSSGMNARLGFSIAAHLDPDVLIIDEVLSVGDMAFQERAFGRMREIVQSGIPVAVVSHQLERISVLSTHAVLLRHGEVIRTGSPGECIATYVTGQLEEEHATPLTVPGLRLGALGVESSAPVPSGQRQRLRLTGEYDPEAARGQQFSLLLRVRRLETGQIVYLTWLHRHGHKVAGQGGPFSLEFDLQFNVPPGVYSVELRIADATSEKILGEGPWGHVEVGMGPSFWGVSQMSPRISLEWASLPLPRA